LTSAIAGRYRLDGELGAADMATVYLAHDMRHDREVAIKVLHTDLDASSLDARRGFGGEHLHDDGSTERMFGGHETAAHGTAAQLAFNGMAGAERLLDSLA